MSEIKPRKSWSIYTKPRRPFAPTEPKKTHFRTERTVVRSITIYSDFYSSLTELIPEGSDITELNLEFVVDRGYECDDDYSLNIFTSKIVEFENPHYEQQMKVYEKEYAKWKAKKEEHANELKEWKAWCAQLKENETATCLRAAEELLKKHGRTVI